VKVQLKRLGPDEETWELNDVMHEPYPSLFNSENTEDGVILRGKGISYASFGH
jgi:hypothetical protein